MQDHPYHQPLETLPDDVQRELECEGVLETLHELAPGPATASAAEVADALGLPDADVVQRDLQALARAGFVSARDERWTLTARARRVSP